MDNELIGIILKDFKLVNNISNNQNDDLFRVYIKKAIQSILNLTNRYEFPEELIYVVLDLVNEFYNDNSILLTITNSQSSESIKSITEKDRTVEFGNSSESTINSLLSAYINDKLQLRIKEINRYRLLYKVKKIWIRLILVLYQMRLHY